MKQKQVSTLAFAWRIERCDGAGLALTSHDGGLDREGIVHRSDPGVVPASVSRTLGLEPHSAEVAGALSAAALTETDLALGRWDGARITLSAIDWEDATAQPMRLMRGELGEIAVNGDSFSADLHGASVRLREAICPSTSPECRARFGDKTCRVDMAGRILRAKLTLAEGTRLQVDQPVDDRFLFGRLRYMSGANCGATTVILAVESGAIRVRDFPKAALAAGCELELREGCDKRFETCVSSFENAANFRGEPHLPGNDLLTRYPGA